MESSPPKHLDKNWLYQKYIIEELSTYEIGKIVSRNPKNVYNKLKDFGIFTRSRAETLKKNSWWKIGNKHWNKGKHRSKETKLRIAEARTGKHYPKLQGKNNGMFGRKGELHPNWKGGSTPERQRLYCSLLWKNIVKEIFKRDNYKCQRCGNKQNYKNILHTHHIKSWADYPENRFDTDNLVTMCKECHSWIHSKKNIKKEYLD